MNHQALSNYSILQHSLGESFQFILSEVGVISSICAEVHTALVRSGNDTASTLVFSFSKTVLLSGPWRINPLPEDDRSRLVWCVYCPHWRSAVKETLASGVHCRKDSTDQLNFFRVRITINLETEETARFSLKTVSKGHLSPNCFVFWCTFLKVKWRIDEFIESRRDHVQALLVSLRLPKLPSLPQKTNCLGVQRSRISFSISDCLCSNWIWNKCENKSSELHLLQTIFVSEYIFRRSCVQRQEFSSGREILPS